MSRKKKSKDETPAKPEPTFKNTGLAQALGQWKAARPEPPPPPKPAPPPPPKKQKPTREEDDDALFLRVMMGEVERLPDAAPLVTPAAKQVRQEELREDAEALARLAELVAESDGFNFVNAGDAVAKGVDGAMLTPLRRGEFPVEARLELPGLSREMLERFLIDARRQGLRCVSVRLNPDNLQAWMSQGRLSRMVLAFATVDGATSFVLRR